MKDQPTITAAQVTLTLPETLVDQIAEAVVARLRPFETTTGRSPWLDTKGAADYIASTPDAVRKALERGLLPGYQPYGPGSRWVLHRDELDEAMRLNRNLPCEREEQP